MKPSPLALVVLAFASFSPAIVAQAPKRQVEFAFKKGDRICILGGGIADRMQHHGWLETRFQRENPDMQLTFRNLGFCGDELTVHQRIQNFGKLPSDPMAMSLANSGYVVWDRYLSHCKADVIFAFFGYNESFAGDAGLEKFRNDLRAFIAHVRTQKYNGKSAPRLVLFSSIPHEDLGDPRLPNGKDVNKRIAAYTKAGQKIAKADSVPFVDLFTPLQKMYATNTGKLTINGIHLSNNGNRWLAVQIEIALFGKMSLPRPGTGKLRSMVLQKNLHWHQRYRVTDGYNVYGGRSRKVYRAKAGGESFANYDVLQEEMQVLDAMTANRDKAIWAIAQGKSDVKIDDSNLPAITQVKTNRPGKGPGGAHEYVSGEDGIAKMTPAKGMKVNLFADEKQFPELINPVQMAWDPKGRLWVAVWPSYPRWTPGKAPSDKLLILEDTDGDGKADTCKTFADNLINPTGFEFWNGGVYVAGAPDLWFLKDNDGDDKVDTRKVVLHGLSSGDTHHTANSFVFSPGGALFFQEGTFHMSQIESIYGPVRNHNGCVWRFDPRTWRVDRYIPYNFANPHGHVFDRWGQDFMTDGTGNVNYYSLPFSGFIKHPDKHRGYFSFFRQRSRPCAATEILSSSHFPKANQGNLLIANVIGFLGIFQYKFVDADSGFSTEEVEPLVSSTDPNFRPSDIEVGPDGAVYFCDWHNAIIGHLQHHIRDPSRDNVHGRVYRVTYEGRETTKPEDMTAKTTKDLVAKLTSPDDRVRYAARAVLSGRETAEVVAAAKTFAAVQKPTVAGYEHHLLEMLWLHQQHGEVDLGILNKLLRGKDPRARAAATRVLRYSRHLVKDALALLKKQANDEHPRVRLEAVVAASFFDSADAAAVALEVMRHPTDKFIDYALKETLRALEPRWKTAMEEGRPVVAADNRNGVEFLLGRVSAAELAKLPRLPAVVAAMMTRQGVDSKVRLEAAVELAKASKSSPAGEVLKTIHRLDGGKAVHANHVLHDLGGLLHKLVSDGATVSRDAMVQLADKGKRATTRQLGYALWIALDKSADKAWASASRSCAGLQSFLGGIAMVADANVRAKLYDKIRPLMFALPVALRQDETAGHGPGLSVDYFSPAPRNATLEAFARHTPTKSMVLANFGLDIPAADRGGSFGMLFRGTLRVPKTGRYVFFTNSDDGSRLFIGTRSIVDNDGRHGMKEKRGRIRLTAGTHPITVTFFDQGGSDGLQVSWKGPGFKQQRIPDNLLSSDNSGSVRHTAIRAMAHVPGHEAEKFIDAARLIGEAAFLDPAVEMLRGIPKGRWPKNQIHAVVDTLAGYVSSLPAEERTEPRVVGALQLGAELARALPKEVSDAALKRLKGLGGSTVLVRTVPHRMLYDLTEFWVEAGKPVAIVFQNNDMMPHNLVVTKPGTMDKVGRAAEMLDGKGSVKRRNFIPESSDVLWYSSLIYPGTSERITFIAPKKSGKYPFVCTFPGHWSVMNGTMHVVEKVDPKVHVAKRADAGSTAPARKFVKNWKLADLEGAVAKGWESGRDTKRGHQLYTEAGCAKCHVVGGKGTAKVGPDLTGIVKKYQGKELLRHILNPSDALLEGYETFYLEIKDGEDVLGRVMKDDGESLHVVTNFDKPDELTVIAKSRIAEQLKSTMSTMPTGLLVTFSKEEILDLLAFLSSTK